MREAITALQEKIDEGHLRGLDLRAAKARLDYTKKFLSFHAKGKYQKYGDVLLCVVRGRGRPAHEQYSEIRPCWNDAFPIPAFSKDQTQDVTFVMPAKKLGPGDYTVIVTPLDQTNAGFALVGASDTIGFTVEEKNPTRPPGGAVNGDS